MKEPDYYRQKLKSRPSFTAFLFAAALTIAESFFFRQNYAGFFRAFSFQTFDDALTLALVFFGFAALFFFVRSMLVSNFRWQCVYFAWFVLALSIEYGFYGALGRFSLPTDAENAFRASDASDKFGAVTLFFNWAVLVPAILFRLLFSFGAKRGLRGAGLFAFNMLLLPFVFALLANFYRPLPPLNAFAAHFNTLASSAVYFGEKSFAARERRSVSPVEAAALDVNIVFIVDESVRADHLSVNGYARDTTPTLRSLAERNLLRSWPRSVSGATESVGSNRLLLTGLNALPDRAGEIRRRPTIFQYARAAGYRTFYFDGQNYSGWIGDAEDRREFGRVYAGRDFPAQADGYDLDRAFAAKIREIVAASRGNFIWVNKRGVHFRYEKNYPAENSVWPNDNRRPAAAEKNSKTDSPKNAEIFSDKETVDTRARRQTLVDSYDNAIFYNSESFFQTLIGDRLPPGTVFVYTSDHGQTLLPGRATHAGDSNAEALVPIVMIGDDARLRGADTGFAAAHSNLFATLLDLMNYPHYARRESYAASLLTAKTDDSKPRSFFVGNPSGAFGGRQMIFDEP